MLWHMQNCLHNVLQKQKGTPKVDAQVVHHCPVFKQMMEENEVLRSYAVRLKELGYDRIDTLKYINADDMAIRQLNALASPVHLELEGELTIRDDYDGGM